MTLSLRNAKGIATLVVIAVMTVVVVAVWPMTANEKSVVGYIDADAVVTEYLNRFALADFIRLEQEIDRLQSEFDAEREGLSPEEEERLYLRYEAELAAFEDARFSPHFEKLQEALEQVAQEQGVTVVLDVDSVLWGGVDLTDALRKHVGLVED